MYRVTYMTMSIGSLACLAVILKKSKDNGVLRITSATTASARSERVSEAMASSEVDLDERRLYRAKRDLFRWISDCALRDISGARAGWLHSPSCLRSLARFSRSP
ncbi:hypothetical protein MSG28_001898 [Choristoneura fumiferana]|uniref:Uncharacterized protein n=1 Tax=Choristoneura fumiferana TaxID=7141 RepID=A0ACC0JTG2_CHOFU|nr:hypothetical protein MSG28_001898 [Choristoneura fumiferana]